MNKIKLNLIIVIAFCIISPMNILSFPINGMLISKSGDVEEVNVVDTNGCDITTESKGNIIKLKKDFFKCLILGNDTTKYPNDYKCKKSIISTSKVSVGYNRERLFNKISQYPNNERSINDGLFYYYKYPLEGKVKDELMDSAFQIMKDIIIKDLKSRVISKTEFMDIIEKNLINNGYVIIPISIKYGYFDGNRLQGDLKTTDIAFDKLNTIHRTINKVHKTVVRIIVIDISKKEIVLDINASHKEINNGAYDKNKRFTILRALEKANMKLRRRLN